MTLAKQLAQNETLQALLTNSKSMNSNLAAIAIAQGKQANLGYEEMLSIVAAGAGKTMFPVGSVFTSTKDTYTYPFAVMHHGIDTDGEPYMIARVIKAIDNLQFDGQEAFYYCENGLAAGTYYITVKNAWSTGCVVDATWNFTLTQAVPAGGQLVGFTSMPDRATDYTGHTVSSFASNASRTPIETVAVTAGTVGTALCDFAIVPTDTNTNSLYRLVVGSNNVAQSSVWQWLNSSAAAGKVWTPQTKFDRPPAWASTETGFLNRIPQGLIDIAVPTTISVDTNNQFETGYSTNSSYTLKGKFFLPSRYNVFGSIESHDFSEVQWDFYKGATDKERIMYDNSGAARCQWLFTPHVGGSGSVGVVDPTGVLGSYNACYTVAVAPACKIRALNRSL